MANNSFRVAILDSLLREVGIPFDGISVIDINATPVNAVIQFKSSATAEQIALGNQMLAAFDWRKRRALTRSIVVNALQQLTPAQQNAILRHAVCEMLRNSPQLAAQVDAVLGTSLPVDEVDPS